MNELIKKMPKVELHMHIEGSMEPEVVMQLAEKNKIKLPYSHLDELKAAYNFSDLAAFVDLYIQGTEVMCSAEDFYLITQQYLQRCQQENIKHAEVFCDIRTYVDRGHAPEMVIEGIAEAFKEAHLTMDISGGMIPCFIRHLGAEKAAEDLQMLLPYKDQFLAIGLAAVEIGFPPSIFKEVFADVKVAGIPIVAHAGEEGPPEYIWSAIRDINANRIDHGIRCLEDDALVEYLVESQIPLTVCPCSNVSLNIFSDMSKHVLPEMLRKGLNITINSDDPAHFGAYLTDNLIAIQSHCGITNEQIKQMMMNAINASFAPPERKNKLQGLLTDYSNSYFSSM